MLTFSEYSLLSLTLKNRIVMPPMCMYSSDDSGQVLDFHRIHYGSRAAGGAGLIIQEATAVTRNGRLSDEDLGIWEDSQIPGLADIARLIHSGGAAAAIQLAHAGRKCESSDPETVAPSAITFSKDYRTPRELAIEEIHALADNFKCAAERALQAGFDTVEIHAAHGYLIHEFLSPLSNTRTDEYGGSLENRVRFLQEILAAVRSVWPAGKPLLLRLSASDYLSGGIDIAETVRIVNLVKPWADLFHLSSGGLLEASFKTYPGYQVGFAETIRTDCQVPTIAVGRITELDQVETILARQQADLVALGRELLRNPYWVIRQQLKNPAAACPVPEPYARAFQ